MNEYCKCLQGVRCDAEKCVYNKDCRCTAESVHVGNRCACCSSETCCDTFIEK